MTTNLLIQGDSPNTWMTAQDWQRNFLEPLHLDISKTKTASSHFTQNRCYQYMAFPLRAMNQLPCANLEPNIKTMDLGNIPFYAPTGWFSSWYTWATRANPYQGTPPVGIICNLATGICRFYIFTTENPLSIHKHDGPLRACHACIGGYLSQKASGTLTPAYQDYHNSTLLSSN